MDVVNEPRRGTVRVRCSGCWGSLGRWSVDELTPDIVIGEPRTHPRGRSWLERTGPREWTEMRSVPSRQPRFGFAMESTERGDVLELVCTCRRRVRISAQGLLKLLRRLGWPDEIEL